MNSRAPARTGGWSTFWRFLGVGATATALQFVLLMFLVSALGLGAVAASSLAYAISTLYNYLMSRSFTFRSRRAHRSALPRFLGVAAVGLGLNAVVIWLCVELVGLHYLAAQALATLLTLAWNYACSLRWTFANTSWM